MCDNPLSTTVAAVMMNDDAIYCAAVVTTPSLRKYRPSVSDNHNGTVSINYNPTEPGAHTLELNYAGVPVQSSPYKFSVQPVQLGRVSAFGPGLSSGLAGQPASFTAVTKDAGPGHFLLSICLSVCLRTLYVSLDQDLALDWPDSQRPSL